MPREILKNVKRVMIRFGKLSFNFVLQATYSARKQPSWEGKHSRSNLLTIELCFEAGRRCLYQTIEELEAKNADITHSLENQMTYVKNLDLSSRLQTQAIASLRWLRNL